MHGFVVKYRAIVLLVAASTVIRLIAIEVWSSSVTDDRDAYLALAEQLRSGAGYINPHTEQPTAFRPPLLPMALAVLMTTVSASVAVALLNITLGTATVVLTWFISRQMGFRHLAWCAAGWVCVDPLLIRYTAWPMTETLATFLLCSAIALSFSKQTDPKIKAVTGVILGLAVLCRPAFWIAACILCGAELLKSMPHMSWQMRLRNVPWYTLAGLLLTVAPWLIRNRITLGAPVLTTTHGGYTLLLGNNPRFFDEVVRQPWGTVWGAESLATWQSQLDRQRAIDAVANNEVARDRWMYRRALHWIREHPRSFGQAMWLRFRRFWNPLPVGSTAHDVPQTVLGLVGGFYSLTFLLAAIGLFRCGGEQRFRGMLLGAIIASLCLVHCVYWSNTRFRSPVTPVIALLATTGLGGVRREKTRAPKTP
ncbi:MAG: hypothetical protein ABGZ17_02825 [Planctomycetaceae bacterium]